MAGNQGIRSQSSTCTILLALLAGGLEGVTQAADHFVSLYKSARDCRTFSGGVAAVDANALTRAAAPTLS
jgi:hypothetical protein